MKNLQTTLTMLLKKQSLTVTELARQTGLPQPVVYRIVKGEVTNPKVCNLLTIAKFFNLTLDQLMGEAPIHSDEHKLGTSNTYPRLVPLILWEEIFNWLQAPNSVTSVGSAFGNASMSNKTYALKVKDSTMLPLCPKDTILIVDPALSPKDEDFVIAHLPGQKQAFFKQLFFDVDKAYFFSLDPRFEPFILENPSKLPVLGVIRSIQTHFR